MSAGPHPPAFARRLLQRVLPLDVREHIANELDEVFQYKCARDGPFSARLWYCREVLSFTGRFTVEEHKRGRMRGIVESWGSDNELPRPTPERLG